MQTATDENRPTHHRTLTIIVLTAAITAAFAVAAMAASSTFFDVQAGDTHEAGIDFMLESGVTLGCAANAYCPDDGVTRAQMATFMHRLSGNAPDTDPSVNAATLGGLTAQEIQDGVDVPDNGDADDGTLWAFVSDDDLLRGNGVDTVSGGGFTEGRYTVTFEDDVSECGFQATSTPTLGKSAHIAAVAPGGSDRSVNVTVVDAETGEWANADFHLHIVC